MGYPTTCSHTPVDSRNFKRLKLSEVDELLAFWLHCVAVRTEDRIASVYRESQVPRSSWRVDPRVDCRTESEF
jgi:hypothetical protein